MPIVMNFTTQKPEMAHTRTFEDFSKFLGQQPKRLGIVSRMEPYEDMTWSYFTEGLGNVYGIKDSKSDKYQKMNTLTFQWDIEYSFDFGVLYKLL